MLALPLVSASTILTGQERLPYTDGTYINPPAGTYSITQTVNGVTYSNPARINDVWYLNSLVLTNQAPPPTPTPNNPPFYPNLIISPPPTSIMPPGALKTPLGNFAWADLFWVVLVVIIGLAVLVYVYTPKNGDKSLSGLFEERKRSSD